MKPILSAFIATILAISGCQTSNTDANMSGEEPGLDDNSSTPLSVSEVPSQEPNSLAQVTVTEEVILSTSTAFPEDFWKSMPVIPEEISDAAREVYRRGQEMGNNPRSFSKVGDCNSQSPDFLTGFDTLYYLGEYEYLQPAIDYFRESFRRVSQTANPGMNTARLLSFLWKTADCPSSDTLLECQYRVDRPSFAIISLGTNDGYHHQKNPQAFEKNMRTIIERTMELGIIPILTTKADNNEGDNSINPIIARLAMEYQIPLWNFWRAVQPLANHGLEDHEHLNYGSSPPSTDFRMPISLEYGSEMRNLTALQLLYFLMQELGDPALLTTPTATSP